MDNINLKTNIMNSTILSINWLEALKGFVVAVIGAILGAVYSAIQGNTFAFTWTFFQPVLILGIGAGISYLIQTFFRNSQGIPFKTEPK